MFIKRTCTNCKNKVKEIYLKKNDFPFKNERLCVDCIVSDKNTKLPKNKH